MKTLKIAAMAAGVLLLAGCGNKAVDNQNENQEQVQTENKSEKSGIINSIKDAMGMGKTMRCEYKIKDANGEESSVVTFVDGKKYKTDMKIAGQNQHMIFDEEAMYSWTEGQKQGMKMTMACSEELAKNVSENNNDSAAPTPDPTGEKTFDNALDVKCEEAARADFSIPADVEFQDQCEMMKNMMKNIPANIPTDIPANIPKMPAGTPTVPQLIP